MSQEVREVQDWSGGTRITQYLHPFNRQWSRRVLSGKTPCGRVTNCGFCAVCSAPIHTPTLSGKLQLENLQPPTSYTLRFEGQGGAAGHGKGSADIQLLAVSAHQTLLNYQAQASVGGKIAQIGSRLVDMAAQKMATEFFSSFNTALQARYGVAPAPAPQTVGVQTSGWLGRILAWFRGLFGR